MQQQFHLVDVTGKPLDERYDQAAWQLKRRFFQMFPKVDPADVCTVVEESAKKTASYEVKHGQIQNLAAFLLRVFVNGMKSLMRDGYYASRQESLSSEELQKLALFAYEGNPRQIEMRVLAEQALRSLDEDKRSLFVAHAAGYSGEELAKAFGISESNVNVTICRSRQKLREILSRCRKSAVGHSNVHDGAK
jgi:RNA polymerase sigma factor (sigma-70 family)